MHVIRPIRQRLLVWGTLFALGVLFLTSAPALAQEPVSKVSWEVNKKMCKLFGAGGFKGLPSYGTGILVSPDGYILTVNNHILTTTDLRVHLYDGRLYRAEVLYAEPSLDVALCKIKEPVDGLPHFNFEEAASKPLASNGDWVLAFSNQFQIATRSEPMSVSHGSIMAYTDLRGRKGVFQAPFDGKVYFLDVVACNPGSAGGIVTNRKGDLLGILGRELKNRLSDTWINYAVPIQAEVEMLRDDKKVKVSMATFVKEAMEGKYREGKKVEFASKGGGFHGIILVPNVVAVTPPYVDGVEKDSPAAKAGLRQDDLIVYIDGELVSSIHVFRELLNNYGPGDPMRIDVQRGNQLETVTLTLEKMQKRSD
jgi:S1-C subfamily serine protease